MTRRVLARERELLAKITAIHRSDIHEKIAAILGEAKYEVVGECTVEIAGHEHRGLILTQQWPFLPFGADPWPYKRAKRYAAIYAGVEGLEVVEVDKPEVVAS